MELSDALLCADGPVRALVELALAPEHRRSHASLYAALNRGDLDADRLRAAIAARSVPRGAGPTMTRPRTPASTTCRSSPSALTLEPAQSGMT
ncbi:transposase [Kitasatospora sp. NPDC087271]|uniref:transposase n=1 Tax=Kitasatospora sp. NPDC087271 TaxID=3364067 RepID=UPI00382F0B9E